MEEIDVLYYNSLGITFNWKECSLKDKTKIQLIFRNTGLSLTLKQLRDFSKKIDTSLENPLVCSKCKEKNNCKSILLESCIDELTFSMSLEELNKIEDLVKGTLFQINLNNYLKKQMISY